MNPSSYSRLGRRRHNSKERSLEVQSDDGEKILQEDPQGQIRRSLSGSALPPNHQSNPEAVQNECSHGADLLQVDVQSNSHPSSKSNLEANNTLGTCQTQNENSSSQTERHRNRSGSWNGADESEDELAHVSRSVPVSSPLTGVSQSLEDLMIPSINYESYQNSALHNLENNGGTDSTNCDCFDEDRIKRNLKFFFMNPIEKWHAKKRLPWKLVVQIIKIIICTIQLCLFASQRYSHVTYLWDTKVSLSHLFIKGWDTSREVTAYPPANGPLAIYEIQDFYDFIDYSVDMFSTIEKTSIGAYKYDMEGNEVILPSFCFSEYVEQTVDEGDNRTYVVSNNILKRCIKIPSVILNGTKEWSIKDYLSSQNMSINFDLLVDASYGFSLKTTKMKSDYPFDTPECYSLETLIYFDNSDHDGQMLVELDIGAKVLDCKTSINPVGRNPYLESFRSVLNLLTIVVCLLSFVMCFRAIFRAQSLKVVVNNYFKNRFLRELTVWEKLEFFNFWYALICFSDFLNILGSVIKMGLESQDYEGYLDKWNFCSLLLGTGNLFIWFGCLRYLGFFETYNVLILTIKKCFPNVLRYSICIMMVFAGYSFCGWLVLGPYHIKFRSFSATTECLYSLINGDDMFATFSSTIGRDNLVWWFSRIYLYTFISLFIYVILSLFIAIITDAYDTIKRYYEVGFPLNDLKAFANECQEDPRSGVFHDEERTMQDWINHICCCCPSLRRLHLNSRGAYEPIPT